MKRHWQSSSALESQALPRRLSQCVAAHYLYSCFSFLHIRKCCCDHLITSKHSYRAIYVYQRSIPKMLIIWQSYCWASVRIVVFKLMVCRVTYTHSLPFMIAIVAVAKPWHNSAWLPLRIAQNEVSFLQRHGRIWGRVVLSSTGILCSGRLHQDTIEECIVVIIGWCALL